MSHRRLNPKSERAQPDGSARRRWWLFRCLAIAISLAPFLLLEAGLRVFGFGDDTRLVVHAPHTDSPTTFHFNPPADRAYYGPEDLSGPDPRVFELPKPEDVYRIVVIGGSTVAGFPYSFELAMPRHLEVVLEQQLPQQKFEVLNAGITSINSFSEVDVMRQVVRCDLDLIVVHSGHNEFYGPGGSASNASGVAPGLYPFMQAMRRQRSFQFAISLIPRPKHSQLIETLPADTAIPLQSDIVERTRARYRSNLRQLVALAERAQIPLIVSSVPSKLREFVPFQSISDDRLTGHEREVQEAQLKEAMRLVSYAKYTEALATLSDALQVDPGNALLMYRAAQCFEALQRDKEAAKAYLQAADLDGCRLRAPSSFANVARDVAEKASGQVFYCDVAKELQAKSPCHAPGDDCFLEHVHYNVEGSWRAAGILGKFIVERVLDSAWNPERFPDNPLRDKLLGVTTYDYLVADIITTMMCDVAPLNLSPARNEDVAHVRERLRSNYAVLTQQERDCFTTLRMEAMVQDVLIGMGYAFRDAGHEELALEAFQKDIFRRRWEPAGYIGAVRVLRALGRQHEAEQMFDRAVEIAPKHPLVRQLEENGG